MFKKYSGHRSKLKTPDELNKKTQQSDSRDDKSIYNSDEKEKFGLDDSLKWPGMNDKTGYNEKKAKITQSFFDNKKKFSFPEVASKSSIKLPDFSNLDSKILNYFKYRFHVPKSVLMGLVFGLALACIIIFISIVITDYKKVKSLADFQPNITTKIYDKNGLLVSELFKQKRDVVAFARMPQDLINSIIAKEDNDFYKHFGLNIKGMVRAFFINLFAGKVKQGGSTITQQLAKIVLTSGERNIFRKVKEMVITLMIEVRYTKKEILELYLNQIFLGHGVYGVESASQFYFNKHVWELNLAECALIATLPSAPNKLSPIRHTERSIEKHRAALAKMVDCGFITIPAAEKAYLDFWPVYLEFINELPPTITSWSNKVDRAPWFTEYVRRKLVKQFGEQAVYRDGYSVYTTLDLKKQVPAQKYLQDAIAKQSSVSDGLSFKNEDYIIDNFTDITELFSLLSDISLSYKKGSLDVKQVNDYVQSEVLDELDCMSLLFGCGSVNTSLKTYREKRFGNKGSEKVQGCLISIDQRTGYIEAMVGGAEFSSINQLNRAMQSRRQAGSAIKGLLYSAAMESKKFTPASTILDSPYISVNSEGEDWIPDNYDERYYGLVRLRSALEKSINVISIKMAEELGISYVMEYFAKLLKLDKKEAKDRIPRNFSIAIGTLEVSPYELTRAYAIIANGGRDVIPFSIKCIKDRNGNIVDNPEEEAKNNLKKEADSGAIQIIEPATAQIMISMLRSVMTSGTGISASIGRPAGGKTGTNSNYRDAWFVGFTPQLTTCVWAGYDDPGLSLGHGQTGGVISAPIWGDYMREALADEPALEFPYYAPLVTQKVCATSGLLPSPECKKVIDEVFIDGTAPESECNICRDLKYNIDPSKTTPKDNISEGQKDSILENIKNKKDDPSIFNKLGKDLLE
jgi:penicillin-binding protein 1A